MLVFFYATSITDLSALIDQSGISDAGKRQLFSYPTLIVALGVFIAAIGRRSAPPVMVQVPAKQRKLSKRTLVAAVLIECMVPFFLVFESRKPKARELVTIAVLCVIAIAGRSAFFMLPQFKPVLALVIVSGVAFGGETGFLVGAVTVMVSNVLFCQGPWMPWQVSCSVRV